ncbi:50S ribosomal protein L34e [Candidatus Woesearchaeota archaeon]|nr:MAG: 50S ribosomal protein L34e [Candidatus Woesearchaeota archaeon]
MQGRFKSGRFRKRSVRVTGGTVTRFEERRPRQARCAETGQPLPGVPRLKPSEAKNTPKTEKRPQRPYGGVLSSRAMRARIRKKYTSGSR